MKIEERVGRLEQGTRRWRLVAGVLAIAAIVVVAAGAKPQEQIIDVLRAHRLEIVNENGVPIVWLQSDKLGNGVAVVANKDSTPEAVLYGPAYGGCITVYRSDETVAAKVAVANEAGVMNVYGKNEKVAAGLLARDLGGALQVNGSDQNLAVGICADERGGSVGVLSSRGKNSVGLTARDVGGALLLFNAEGKPGKLLGPD